MQLHRRCRLPGNVRQLKNLIESMVVLAPEGEIRSAAISLRYPRRKARAAVRIDAPKSGAGGQELEFIFRTLVDLKMQLEDLRRRIEGGAAITTGGGLLKSDSGIRGLGLRYSGPNPIRSPQAPTQAFILKAGCRCRM